MAADDLLKELKMIIEKYERASINRIDSRLKSLSKFDEKDILTGILPKIFLNQNFFPSNNEVIQFANRFLQLNISSKGNRSKAELIGKIIVELHQSRLDKKKISKITNQLLEFTKGEIGEKKKKKTGEFFSKWNKLIKDMDIWYVLYSNYW